MNETQLELTRLFGDKTLSFGCEIETPNGTGPFIGEFEEEDNCWKFWTGYEENWGYAFQSKIIGHPATLTDFHRLIFKMGAITIRHYQNTEAIEECIIINWGGYGIDTILYDSSKPLLDQSPETLSAILNLVKSHG